MRPSKREQILETAVEMIDADGLDAVTYDSLSQATGVSKSGLIYHFPSRHELMLGVHRHLAEEWERELVDAAGAPAADVSPTARLRALVLSLSGSATRADLLVQLDAASHPDFENVWREVDRRWSPAPEEVGSDPAVDSAYLVLLAAEGLWLHDHAHLYSLTPEQRTSLTEAILGMIPGQDS